jgi:transcriptional regulator
MYVRASHQPRSQDDVVQAMRENMFATLVTASREGMIASHLPFVFDPAQGGHGTLYAHMARANQHGAIVGENEALVIFSGPHGYISPSWYEDRETAPTWDYVAVHCYGIPRLHSDEEARHNIERLIDVVEAAHPRPWSMRELPEADVLRMIRNVVSFEIPLTRIEAKFKLNQGEKVDRNTAAVEQLERQGDTALADYIRRYNDLQRA